MCDRSTTSPAGIKDAHAGKANTYLTTEHDPWLSRTDHGMVPLCIDVARGLDTQIQITIADVLYEGLYGIWPVSSVSVWLLGGLV